MGLTIKTQVLAQQRAFQLPTGITQNDYLPGEIVIKVRAASSVSARTSHAASDILTRIQKISQAEKVRPILKQTDKPSVLARQEEPEKIYRLHTNQDVVSTINQLLQLEEVVYAEPYYVLKPLAEYVPNDPEAKKAGQQSYLEAVQAYEAWALEKGNEDILIGYLDTGVEFGHQDLTGNLYRNEADPINGVDDDGDGYIDNYVGWDFANGDNDPTADYSDHGTMVAGMGSGSPDNQTGIAGLGFNTSYMPIKIFRSENNLFAFGYEAIAYAADRGCKVINLSWGGANAYSQFGQDMINYAVLEKDVVVVAAAGNSGKHENYYPASFDNVLSVAVSDDKGDIVGQTTRNYFVDLMAPGSNVYSTKNNDSYGKGSGSSFASPLVSGAAALVRAHYPELSARQVMEVLRLSSKSVYDQAKNQGYEETLGKGLLQTARALKPIKTPALRMTSFTYKNQSGAGAYAYYGDTLTVSINVQNFLSPSSGNTHITLSALSEYVTVLDSEFAPGPIDSLAIVSNASRPFQIVLHPDLPTNEQLFFRLGMEDGTYQDYQYFFIVSSSDYLTLTKNDLHITVGSNGMIGYDPTGWTWGRIQYQNQVVASEAGLLVGVDSTHLSDNLLNSFQTKARSQDFSTLEGVRFTQSSIPAYQVRSAFTDANAMNPLNIHVEQTWLTDTLNEKNFIISEYRVSNPLDSALSNVAVGVFADWNMENSEQNRTGWDAANQLGYTFSANQKVYTGFALLTGQSVNYRALDVQGLNGNELDIAEDISEGDKYRWASEGGNSSQAGVNGAGNDVAQVLSATINGLESGKGDNVAFVWVAGASLAELQAAVAEARTLYESYQGKPEWLSSINVCMDSTAFIQLAETHRFYEDALGTKLITEADQWTTSGITNDTSFYVAPLTNGFEGRIKRIVVQIKEPIAQFSVVDSLNRGWKNDTLFLDESNNTILTFQDQSANAVAWFWNFGNGYKSSKQHPQTQYTQPGTYTLELTTQSEPGCTNTLSKQITVVRRSEMPQLPDEQICGGSSTILKATNTEKIKVYTDEALSNLLYEGSEYTTDAISQTTTFYVVNSGGAIDSYPVPVVISVWKPELRITYNLDLTDLSSKYKLNIGLEGDTSAISHYDWYINEVPISQKAGFTYDFTELAQEDWHFRLVYTVESAALTCTYVLEENIVRTSGEKPDLSVLRICKGEPVTIAPTNGRTFYFYQDASLTTPIHKGETLMLDSVSVNTTIYVTSLSGLVESEPSAVDVIINQFADFKVSADTIYLSEPDMAVFQAYALDEEVEQAISWQWDLGDGQFTHQSARITPRFDSAGVYSIRLLATREDGCTNQVSKVVVVRNVASNANDIENQSLKIYPNPTRDVFYLENLLWYQKDINLSLLSLDGQFIIQQDLFYSEFPLPISLSSLAQPIHPGLYILRVQRDDKVFIRKIMIE
uniref:S8 family serine peptidase n=1 Tax=Roseihalotalea indica TaxID=2867963 RepID=A0AA49JC37_9BACT|nr:S8 family serine peptidase [Tunicatimonas sp. TK19036]